MASSRSLILSFIDKRPGAAARALAVMDAEDAAALLADIPVRFATRVLTHMGAWDACSLLTRMDDEVSAAVLSGFHYPHAAALLRLMDDQVRNRILQELPAPIRRDFRTTLSFPRDTVGAHMTTAVLTQRMDHTVADARDQIRRATRADTGCIIVIDEGHRMAGVVSPVALLRTTGHTVLQEIMDSDLRPISARARISTIDRLEGWYRYTSLPVISRRMHVIGALSREALYQAADQAPAPSRSEPRGSAGALADAFLGYLAGLTQLGDPGPGSTGNPDRGDPSR